MKTFKEFISEGRPIEKRFSKVDNFIKGTAETIAGNTAMNVNTVLEWLENQYNNDKTKIINMMGKYASSKRWKDIMLAVLNGKLLKENLNEDYKPNPSSKKFVKDMVKIKINQLNGYMPGNNYVYYDKSKKQWWFIDFEGDHMELKNIGTLKELDKYLKLNNLIGKIK